LAQHKSSEKRARQSLKISTRNTQTKNAVRSWEKKLRTAIAAKDSAKAQELLKDFSSKIGKAAQKGIIHNKSASRKISRLSAQIAGLK